MAMESLGSAIRNGVSLAWRCYSPSSPTSRVPLVLVHGFACGMDDWGPFHKELAERSNRRVIAFDHRGIGRSDTPEPPYSVPDLAADTLATMDSADVSFAHVMGISMGGMVAQHCGKEAPERCQSLILGCTTHGGRAATPPPMEFLKACGKWSDSDVQAQRAFSETFVEFGFPEGFRESHPKAEEVFAQAVDQFARTQRSETGLSGQFAALTKFSSLKYLESLTMPSLVIHGDQDRVLPYANAESLASKLPNARLERLAGSGHFWWEDNSHDSIRILTNFMDRVEDL